MEKSFVLKEFPLDLIPYRKVVFEKVPMSLADSIREKVEVGASFVQKLLKNKKQVYGINTGFGSLSHVVINSNDIETLQERLILSHCAGVGDPFSPIEMRGMIFLRVLSLCHGHSGIKNSTLDYLLAGLNQDFIPIVPEKGSVGCSGDLAPLAGMVACFMGYGKVWLKGEINESAVALKKLGMEPLKLAAKEGLALINGTCAMLALGINTLLHSKELGKMCDLAATMTLEALRGSAAPFDEEFQSLRPHPGQLAVAENVRRLLQGSEILKSHENCSRVQDAYSLRCIPQVHGASRDTLQHVETVLVREMNSVTDNPILFPDRNLSISGGHFHGQPVAMVCDFMSVALAEWASISERRIDRLMNTQLSELPPFLTAQSGLNSGYMIAQYTAASLVSENKSLAHPACVDSIPTSAYQEDHVSMGSISARKAREVLKNCRQVLEIELLCSTQALDFLSPLKPGEGCTLAHHLIRQRISPLEHDRYLQDDLTAMKAFIEEGDFIEKIERKIGVLN